MYSCLEYDGIGVPNELCELSHKPYHCVYALLCHLLLLVHYVTQMFINVHFKFLLYSMIQVNQLSFCIILNIYIYLSCCWYWHARGVFIIAMVIFKAYICKLSDVLRMVNTDSGIG